MKKASLIFLSIFLIGITNYTFADYPVVSYSYLADPGAIWYNGRLYVYCSNDNENPLDGTTYDMSSIVCVSSSDLKNWTDHGIVFDVPRDASWTNLSWAPSPAYRNGKFYLYYGNGGSAIGVAVSDSPTGPFVDPIGRALVNSSTPGVQPFNGWLFDPMTFIDDDGQAYMYFGGNGDDNLRVIKLNNDMISVNGSATKFTVPNFFEAAWLHKHNGTYYFSYSTNPSAGMRIDYMTSSNPMSGFTYGGIMSPQPPINNNNNHQAVVEINGQWYQVYHNRIVARDNLGTDGMPYHRNLAIDAFSHRADGSIIQMVNTVDGIEQLHYLDPYVRQEGETMSEQFGINTEVCSEGGMNLAYIDNGDWTMIEGVDFGTAGATSFLARVASPTGGTMQIRLGSTNGTLIGTLQVPNTGGYQNWQTETISINNTTGIHNVYFVFTTGGFNLNHWNFLSDGPHVSITTPENNAIFAAPISVPIDIEVSSTNSTITHIDFYLNDATTPFHEEWVAPYAFEHLFEQAGNYIIKAIAYDDLGNTSQDQIEITIYPPQSPYGGTTHQIPGKIECENFDVGGNEFAYFDDSQGTSVPTPPNFRGDEDVDIENCTDTGGGYNIGYATAGEWLEYTVNVTKTGTYTLTIRAACEGDGRTVSLSSDGNDIATDIAIPNTGGWQVWTDVIIPNVVLESGEHIIRLTIGATDYVNLNYVTYTLQGTPIETIQLKQGWNLVGYPYSGEKPIEEALANIWTHVVTVKDFTAFYDSSSAPQFNLLTHIEFGKGYYIYVNEACELEWVE